MSFMFKAAFLSAIFSIIFAAPASACDPDYDEYVGDIWVNAWTKDLVISKPSRWGEGCWEYSVGGQYQKFSLRGFHPEDRSVTLGYTFFDNDSESFGDESSGTLEQATLKNDGKLTNDFPASWCNHRYYSEWGYDTEERSTDTLGPKNFVVDLEYSYWDWMDMSWDNWVCGGVHHNDEQITQQIYVKNGSRFVSSTISKSGSTKTLKGTLQFFDALDTEKWRNRDAMVAVSLQKKSGKTWKTVATTTTDQNGRVVFRYINKKAASYRLHYSGETTNAAVVSKTLVK